MREKHGRRIALPYLEGMNVYLFIYLIQIQKKLGGLAYAGNCTVGV